MDLFKAVPYGTVPYTYSVHVHCVVHAPASPPRVTLAAANTRQPHNAYCAVQLAIQYSNKLCTGSATVTQSNRKKRWDMTRLLELMGDLLIKEIRRLFKLNVEQSLVVFKI